MSSEKILTSTLLKNTAHLLRTVDAAHVETASSLLTNLQKAVDLDFLEASTASELIRRMTQNLEQNPSLLEPLQDAFSEGQLRSKMWIIQQCQELNLDLKTVFLCGGWFGTLFLNPHLKFSKVRSFDKDSSCEKVANSLLHHLVADDWRFKAVTLDIHKLAYNDFLYMAERANGTQVQLIDTADTVINTSCEHIENFDRWFHEIPQGKLVILQSNNGIGIEEHINCSANLSQFEALTPLSETLYSAELALPKFTRFMRIGYK